MRRHMTMLLLLSMFVCRALAQSCAAEDLDLCDGLEGIDICATENLDLCDTCDDHKDSCASDGLDLCDDLEGSDFCAGDDMDLCDTCDIIMNVTPNSTAPPTTTIEGTTAPTTVEPTTVEPAAMHKSSGSYALVVDATAPQVKSAAEKSLGKILFDKGVGANEIEAASYVSVDVTAESRRLDWQPRALAATKYLVKYNITAPLTNANLVTDALKTISADVTVLQDEMLRQFQAAGVTSATSVTISAFAIDQYFFDNTNTASPVAGVSSIMLLLFFALTQRTRFG